MDGLSECPSRLSVGRSVPSSVKSDVGTRSTIEARERGRWAGARQRTGRTGGTDGTGPTTDRRSELTDRPTTNEMPARLCQERATDCATKLTNRRPTDQRADTADVNGTRPTDGTERVADSFVPSVGPCDRSCMTAAG